MTSTFDVKQHWEGSSHSDYDLDFVETIIARLEETTVANPAIPRNASVYAISKLKKGDLMLRKANKDLLGKLYNDQVSSRVLLINSTSTRILYTISIGLLVPTFE